MTDDSRMTGEAGANRTFRSIFGEKKIKQTPDQVLYLELGQSDSSASVTADSSAEVAMNDDDDDEEEEEDETMWNDDMVYVSGGDEEEDGKKEDNNDFLGLQFAQRKSMVEWADDDDDEDTWKEALQDRVNQLELAFQHNDDSTSAQSKRQCEQQHVQDYSVHEIQRADFSQSLPVSTRFAASGEDETDRLRQTCRHKMRRTSSHACITDDNVVASNRPNRLWSCQHKVAGETAATMLNQNQRIRSTSIDFVARNIQLVEHHRKRSGSLSGSDSRTESPSQCVSRKNPLDHSRSILSKSSSSSFCDIKTVSSTCATPSLSSSAAVLHLSDTEAIRRFVLEDVKTMSMERLVSDARRLHFLEDFYQSRQGLHVMPSVATSNSMSQPSLASSSSSSTMSTS